MSSRVAQDITGMTERQLIECEYRRVRSRRDVAFTRHVPGRQNPRFASGRVAGNEDLDEQRARVSVPLDDLMTA